jgi:hypothetical protein
VPEEGHGLWLDVGKADEVGKCVAHVPVRMSPHVYLTSH